LSSRMSKVKRKTYGLDKPFLLVCNEGFSGGSIGPLYVSCVVARFGNCAYFES